MNEEILDLNNQPGGETSPAILPEGEAKNTEAVRSDLYPLDWETTTVKLKEGRFKHKLRRPTADEIYAREEDLQNEIEIGKKGNFQMPDPTASEDADAKIYDLIKIETEGYAGTVPAAHKAAAFQGLYVREIYIDEETDVFGEQVDVLEEFGTGDEPDFTIVHRMRQPAESELKKYRRRTATGEIKPGKRGKQRFISRSTLRNAVEHYDLWCIDVDGVRLDRTASADSLARIAAVDPLIKRRVVQTLVEEITGSLLD